MRFSVKKKMIMSLFVFFAAALGNAGGTLYLPALVKIGADIEASNAWMQLSLSVYLFSISLSQIFYGPLSDAFGRRVNLLVGVGIFLGGSLLAMCAMSPVVLLIGRVIQGLGIGAANAVGFALLRDLYEEKQLVTQLSYLSLFVGLTPVLAPIMGGYLVTYLSWRACFATLALFALILWIFKYYSLPETNFSIDKNAYKPQIVLKNFNILVKHRQYMGFILSVGMAFASLLTFNAILPFVLMNTLHLTATAYGWLAIYTGGGYLLGAYLGSLLGNKFGLFETLIVCALVGVFSNILGYVMVEEHITLLRVLLPLVVLMVSIGAIIPLASSGAMKLFPTIAGSAGALLATCMFLIAAIFTVIASSMRQQSARSLFVILLLMSIITMLVVLLAKTRRKDNV